MGTSSQLHAGIHSKILPTLLEVFFEVMIKLINSEIFNAILSQD